jgi:hypothetical protein
LEVLGVENHILFFDITKKLGVVLGFFSTKHGIHAIIWIHDFSNTKKHKLL